MLLECQDCVLQFLCYQDALDTSKQALRYLKPPNLRGVAITLKKKR